MREIQSRIHSLIGIPEAFGESLYVLSYRRGQKYEAHTDHCAAVSTVRVREGKVGHAELHNCTATCWESWCPTLARGLRVQASGDASSPSCRAFLERAGGPQCGAGGGGATCGDRLATVILYLR